MKEEHEETIRARGKMPVLCKNRSIEQEDLWTAIRQEAGQVYRKEFRLQSLIQEIVLDSQNLGEALSSRLSRKLAREDMKKEDVQSLLLEIFREHPSLVQSAAEDLEAIHSRDPACESPVEPLLFFKGFAAICTYRVSHQLWKNGRQYLAYYFQSLASEVFSVDIHPAAQIGCGILLDHATSFVVGETAIIEDNVSILHEVTLGGTGKDSGARHPIVRSGVLIGAGAKILGRVEIGENAKVGAGSVVLEDVAANTTVAGVPAALVGEMAGESPAMGMNQSLRCNQRPQGN